MYYSFFYAKNSVLSNTSRQDVQKLTNCDKARKAHGKKAKDALHFVVYSQRELVHRFLKFPQEFLFVLLILKASKIVGNGI